MRSIEFRQVLTCGVQCFFAYLLTLFNFSLIFFTNMKRTFAKLIAGVAMLVGFCLFANSASAQQTMGGSAPTSWKPVDQAKQVCLTQVEFWNPKIDQYAPGTSNYSNVVRHITFYKTAFRAMESGESVAAAVELAMNVAVPMGTADAGTTPKAVITAMREEAIELLQ